MSFVRNLVCVCCGKAFEQRGMRTCPGCGPEDGILDVRFDLEAAAKSLTADTLAGRSPTIWRYRELLPVEPESCREELVIGWTPMLEAPRLALELGVKRVRLKDEGRSASASFKDRASAVGVAHALEERATAVACASTGNAASSLAHCAAVVGLPCNIFVPRSVPDGKLAQLLAYGARVFKVLGTYDEAYGLCSSACERFGWYNRNCAINPYLVEGKKTGGLEIAEQCANDPPDWVAVSVGDGCTIAGIAKGLREIRALGLIRWSARMLGVQAEGAAPIARAFQTGRFDHSTEGGTYADSINCPVPRNWRKAVDAVRQSGGAFVTVEDERIVEAVRATGRLSGVFAEPAAAAAVAGVAQAVRTGVIPKDASIVIVITGSGLKDIAGAQRAVGNPCEIKPELRSLLRAIENPPEQSATQELRLSENNRL